MFSLRFLILCAKSEKHQISLSVLAPLRNPCCTFFNILGIPSITDFQFSYLGALRDLVPTRPCRAVSRVFHHKFRNPFIETFFSAHISFLHSFLASKRVSLLKDANHENHFFSLSPNPI